MRTIVGESIDTIYQSLAKDIYYNPVFETQPRGLKIKEAINVDLVLMNPRKRIITLESRRLSKFYLAGELCFYFSGSDKLNMISHYSSFWNRISDDGIKVNSCYGKKLFKYFSHSAPHSQYEYAKQQLLHDKDSRKSVALIYTSENADLKTKDNPCTMYLQFFIRDNRLMMITHMRSCDIWFGLSYDVPFFTIIQEMMYVELRQHYRDLELGEYIHSVGSMHIYEKDFNNIEKVIKDKSAQNTQMPAMTEKSIAQIPELLNLENYLRIGEQGKELDFLNEIKDRFLLVIGEWLLEGKE